MISRFIKNSPLQGFKDIYLVGAKSSFAEEVIYAFGNLFAKAPKMLKDLLQKHGQHLELAFQ